MRAMNSAFSISSGVTAQSHEQIDKAMKEAGSQQVKVGEFKLTKQQEFQEAAKTASEGVSKMSKYAGYLGTGIVMGLGMTNPLTAGLVVGTMTAGGGIIGKKTGKSGEAIKELENSRWFQSDRDDILSNIDKSLVTATVTNAVLAGASAHGAGKAAETATTKAAEEVAKETGKKVAGESGKKVVEESAKEKLKSKIGVEGAEALTDAVPALDASKGFQNTAQDHINAKVLEQSVANPMIPKESFTDMALGKLKTGKDFLTTKPQAQDYKQLSLSNLFTQDKGLRSQFGRDFVGNLKAGAAQFIPGENTTIDALKGTGGTLNDWILGQEEDV